MTLDDVQGNVEWRRRAAHRYMLATFGWVALNAFFFAISVQWPLSREPWGEMLNALGLLMLAMSWAVLAVCQRRDMHLKDRYRGGVLVVERNRQWLLVRFLSRVLFAMSFLVALASTRARGGASVFFIGPLAVLGLAIGLIEAVRLAILIVRPRPAVVISEEGLFAPDSMRGPIAWRDIDFLPTITGGPAILLLLNAPGALGNIRAWWHRSMSAAATHIVYGQAANATQADVMKAIAYYRPGLLQRARTAPPGVSFSGTF